MGYYTSYDLEYGPLDGIGRTTPQCPHRAIPEDAAFCPTCGAAIRAVPVSEAIDEYMRAREDDYYGVVSEESCKWYDHNKAMRALSAEFPGYLFTLRGEGEESGDLWVKYYLNGQSQEVKAQITYAPFDQSLLR